MSLWYFGRRLVVLHHKIFLQFIVSTLHQNDAIYVGRDKIAVEW